MAFKTINKTQQAAFKILKGTVITGYLTGLRFVKAKRKGQKPSCIFELTQPDGTIKPVWANGVMRYNCLTKDKINPAFLNKLVRFRGLGKKSIGKGKSPMMDTACEVDTSKTLTGEKGRK